MHTPHPLGQTDRTERDTTPAPDAANWLDHPTPNTKRITMTDLLEAELADGHEYFVDPNAPTCPNCGNLMLRSGTCHTCPDCGTSNGCA